MLPNQLLWTCLFLTSFLFPVKTYPVGDIRNCPIISPQDASRSIYPMDVLPGIGFDALRSVEMGQVLDYNYSLCRVSRDGKYLLPDNIYLSPVKESTVEEYAEYFDHWDQSSSLTSKTITAHASVHWGFAKIGGSYSHEHTSMKSHMVNDDSSAVRIHLQSKLYAVHAQPRSQLHPDFKSRLFEIVSYLEKNITSYAHYLADLLIRDYGTHYLSSVEAGAIIAQTDYISNDYTEDKSFDSTKTKASASASFFGVKFGGGNYNTLTNNTHDSGYLNNRTNSEFNTFGGPTFRPFNFTIDQWIDGIPDNLVAIDRAGDPLHFIINSFTLPELPHLMREALSDIIYDSMKRYFRVNTHKGCTNPKSRHFDFNANVDDESCNSEVVPSNYTFGGAYQTCTDESVCEDFGIIQQSNPLTHDYSCPDDINYMAVKMFTGTVDKRTRHWIFWHKDHRATYDTYWCVAKPAAEIPENSGFLFGGFYTDSTPNPTTNTMGCPQYYTPLKIGNYMKVCVSTDFDYGFKYAVPFGGFETCLSGNPLARQVFSEDSSAWPHECPHGYTHYFGGVEHGCDINLCVQSGALTSKIYKSLPPRLPPFHVHPQDSSNDTDSLTFTGSDGNVWIRSWLGDWSTLEPPSQCLVEATTAQPETESTTSPHTTAHAQTLQTTTQSARSETETTTGARDGKSLRGNKGTSIAAVTVPTVLGVLIAGVIVIVITVVLVRCHKSRKRYNSLNENRKDESSALNTKV